MTFTFTITGMQIKLNSLVRNYTSKDNTVKAVQNVSLVIPANKVFGIIGKSGAGKSTLVRLISLLEECDSGEIFYNDDRVDNLSKKDLIARRRRIGMIFQNFNLFSSKTVAQNVAYPLEICGTNKATIKNRVLELLKLVDLSDKANSPISTLSGGQKQRVAIARALANNPDILFCDEATSALDPQTTRSILALIREIQQRMNLTVVMITHQMEVVRDACDEVAVLDNGKVVEVASVAEIFANPKTEVTKDFLRHLSQNRAEYQNQNLSKTDSSEKESKNLYEAENSNKELCRWSEHGGEYVLRFLDEKTDFPVLSQLSKKYNVEYNIRAGGIQYLKEDKKVGTMILDILGQDKEVEAAIEYLTNQGIIVEKTGGNL